MHHTAPLFARSGCFAHGLKGGETLYIAEDSEVLQVMGDTMAKEDHRKHSQAQPLNVIAARARVRVARDYTQQRELNTNGAPLASRNPWILGEVEASPVEAQRGWKGWVHVDDRVDELGTVRRLPVFAIRELGDRFGTYRSP